MHDHPTLRQLLCRMPRQLVRQLRQLVRQILHQMLCQILHHRILHRIPQMLLQLLQRPSLCLRPHRILNETLRKRSQYLSPMHHHSMLQRQWQLGWRER